MSDEQDRVDLYAEAVIKALADAGRAEGKPDINAAISALAYSQAYLIAKIEDRNARRVAERLATESLGKMIAKFVNERLVAKIGRGAPN